MSSSSLAYLLLDARKNGTPFAWRPEFGPASLEEAYAISAEVAAALGAAISGWKVGVMADGRGMGAPMFASGFRASEACWIREPAMPLIPEVEVAVRLSRDIPPRPERPYSRDEVLDHVGQVLIGLELIARRFTREPAPPPIAGLADDLGNCGFVLGPAISTFRNLDFAALKARFRIGAEWREGRPHPKGDPIIPLIAWANDQCDRLGGLRAGQIVTLGSLTPMVAMHAPAVVEGEIAGLGRVAVEVVDPP
jgi:2-keto-4-pentenoate hydratase